MNVCMCESAAIMNSYEKGFQRSFPSISISHDTATEYYFTELEKSKTQKPLRAYVCLPLGGFSRLENDRLYSVIKLMFLTVALSTT